MVVSCVQHYYTHFIKKLEESLESFFIKSKKTAKKGGKGQKREPKILILGYFNHFLIFGPFLLILNKQTK